MHSHVWSSSDHKTVEHQNRLGTNPNIADHRTTSEHKSGPDHRSHHSDGRSHSREPLKESRSRPPSQQSSKVSPANSTHSGYSPIRKDKEKDISPLSDEDLIRSSGGRYESSKKWPHPDDSSHTKHKRPHGKKRPNVESPTPLYSKKHHRDERTTSGHRGGGGVNPEWKNERGQGSSRGGTPERKEKRHPSHYHHLPSSESMLHDSGIVPVYGRDGPTFNGKGDLRRRSYESISDEDMLYEPSREGSLERKSLYDLERVHKKDRKKRIIELTDSSEEDHHTVVGGGGSESRPPASSVLSAGGGTLGARTKHKKHKYSKEHKESWRKIEHSKESSSGTKHKHSHHHHKR